MVNVIRALAHPKDTLIYLLLGKEKYFRLKYTSHTCASGTSDLPFSSRMVINTDIHEHLVTLYMLTTELGLKTTVELGTRGGESTVALLHAAKGVGGQVFSYDIDACEQARNLVRGDGLDEFWHFTQMNDLDVKWNRPIDHLFIDTSHLYDQTTLELQKFEPWVRKGGVITLHDTVTFPEVRRAIKAYSGGRQDLRTYEYLNNNGLYVIFKGSS